MRRSVSTRVVVVLAAVLVALAVLYAFRPDQTISLLTYPVVLVPGVVAWVGTARTPARRGSSPRCSRSASWHPASATSPGCSRRT